MTRDDAYLGAPPPLRSRRCGGEYSRASVLRVAGGMEVTVGPQPYPSLFGRAETTTRVREYVAAMREMAASGHVLFLTCLPSGRRRVVAVGGR